MQDAMQATQDAIGCVHVSRGGAHNSRVALPAQGIIDVAPGVRAAAVARRDRRHDLLLLLGPHLRLTHANHSDLVAARLAPGESATLFDEREDTHPVAPLTLHFTPLAAHVGGIARCDICRDDLASMQGYACVCAACTSAACKACRASGQCLRCGASLQPRHHDDDTAERERTP